MLNWKGRDGAQDTSKVRGHVDVGDRENDFVSSSTSEEIGHQKILFVVEPLKPVAWVIHWQRNIMNAVYTPLSKCRKDLSEKHRDI